jgi:hypothetical protein
VCDFIFLPITRRSLFGKPFRRCLKLMVQISSLGFDKHMVSEHTKSPHEGISARSGCLKDNPQPGLWTAGRQWTAGALGICGKSTGHVVRRNSLVDTWRGMPNRPSLEAKWADLF